MPFRHAHVWLLLLFPAILLAFWPGYFGDLRAAPAAFHLHGLAATAWIGLVAAQSWTAHDRRRMLHRAAGLALFLVVPPFVGGGLLIVQAMALLGLRRADPFHAAFGVRLAFADLLSVAAFLALVCAAIVWRRTVRLHAAAMLGTVVLVLPPIVGRLLPMLPGFPGAALTGLHPFALSFQLSQALAIGLSIALAARDRRSAPPLLAVAAVLALESVGFATVARAPLWRAMAARLGAVPPMPLLAGGGAVAALALWIVWTRPAMARRSGVRLA